MNVSQCDVVTQLQKYSKASTGCVSIIENDVMKTFRTLLSSADITVRDFCTI